MNTPEIWVRRAAILRPVLVRKLRQFRLPIKPLIPAENSDLWYYQWLAPQSQSWRSDSSRSLGT